MIEFEIVVDGRLGPRVAAAFEGLRVEPGEHTTVLRGTGPDRARLHGVLAHLEDLGVDLVSLSSHDVDEGAGPARPGTGRAS